MRNNLLRSVTIPAALVILLIVLAGPAYQQERPKPFRGNPAVLEPAGRDAWQMPERVMDTVGVKPGMTIGELGAGGGYFTLWLAKRVGKEGHVFANDINERFLEYIASRCLREGIGNVTTVLGGEAEPNLPEGSLDMAIMVNVLHEVADPVPFLRAIRPSLKESATLVIVDYDRSKRRSSHTYVPEQAVAEAEDAGYVLQLREDYLPRQFILVFKPFER